MPLLWALLNTLTKHALTGTSATQPAVMPTETRLHLAPLTQAGGTDTKHPCVTEIAGADHFLTHKASRVHLAIVNHNPRQPNLEHEIGDETPTRTTPTRVLQRGDGTSYASLKTGYLTIQHL